jgi:hypothetical protein
MVHSLAVDTATHRVYAPEQQEDGRPVARMIIYEPVPRPPEKRWATLKREPQLHFQPPIVRVFGESAAAHTAGHLVRATE